MPPPIPPPGRLRPFVPLIAAHNRQRSLSPPPDLNTGVNNTPLPASSGMFLLIRNILPPNKPGFGKPVDLVREAIAEALLSDHENLLTEIGVAVIPGGRPQDVHSSSAYLELSIETRQRDPLPRPDLLTDWMKALKATRPDWDIVWAPQRKGKDRRMTVRFRVAESKEKVPTNASDKIRAHLESKGHKTTGGYTSYNGLVDITLADTRSVDMILSSSYYIIPTISKDGMHVSPPKYIAVNNPFELCIGGLNEYEGLHEIIEKWLYHKYTHDNGFNSARVYNTRISDDREFFLFTMDSWESTLIVLKDTDAFHTYFSNSPLLTEPKLLFELNSSGFARKSITSTIDAGAGLVNDAIAGIKRDLTDFRKEQTENNNLVQRQVASIHTNMETQTNAIATIGNQVQQSNLAFLASRDEKAIESRIAILDGSIAFELACLRFTDDAEELADARRKLATLKNERRDQATLLAGASDITMRMIGPAPGSTIPPPPAYNSSNAQPSAVAAHDASPHRSPRISQLPEPSQSPTTSQMPPARQPVSNAHSTPARPAVTPARIIPRATVPRTASPSHSQASSFSSATSEITPAAKIAPLAFNFSSLITPTSFPAPCQSAKRSKPADVPESPTKRRRSTERGSSTRSASRAALLNDSNPVQRMDVFNDSGPIVRNASLTFSPLLITAFADKGKRLSQGSRPLKDAPFAATKQQGTPQVVNQLGRVCYAETSPVDTFCRSYKPNPISRLIHFMIVIILLLMCANSAGASASPAGTLSFYALNTNGFVHPTKIDFANRSITHRNPDVFVITETKTNSSCTSKLPYNEYQIFEERGTPVTGHHLYKWGAVLGIKKSVTVSQRVMITQSALKGRLIAVDLVIPLESGSGFSHRVIAAYAPWNVTDTSDTAAFWVEVTKLCNSTPHPWTLLGDLNATITQAERRTGGSDARAHYLNFIKQSKGFDLWSNYPERSRLSDWTCKPRTSTDGGSIIDRIATSLESFLDTEIFAADGHLDFVPMTDHRPIIGRINLKPPDRLSTRCLQDRPCPVLNNPRIKFPDYKDKHLFQQFRDETDAKIKNDGLDQRTIVDDATFVSLYSDLTKVVNETATQVFGRIKRKKPHVNKIVTNVLIQQLQGRSRAIGGALRHESNPSYTPTHAAKTAHTLFSLEYAANASNCTTLREFMLAKRKATNKDLYRERSNEIYARAKRYDSFRISQALMGGSTKRLVHTAEFVPLPLAINTIDASGKLLSDPDEVKAETRRYWEKLYSRQPITPMDKPWLTTKSVKEVHDRVSSNPFVWPRKASISDFRALVRRGNARPSPGPDGTEKWCVKSLTDFSLKIYLDLHNYMTHNSSFPGDTKDMYLTMFHKRGLRTDLNNWRGLMISNFIANSPMTWLNYLLTPFIAANAILPDTQVATQQGVQTRDLTSFLAGVLTWANRHKTPVYALKRDQMKGFDYLAPEGFYDAITAYGLPREIIEIDKAAQTNTKVFIRTAHGLTEPIIVSGVAKQGGPISPLKSTLTTSLGHRLLDDVASETAGALTITTASHDRNDPHLPNDNLSLPIRMIEATDDSIIFARSIPALQSFCLLAERFQYAYGWLTNWTKTTAFILSPDGIQPTTLSMPSITIEPGVSPLVVTNHDVPLVPNELDFLRVKINNPSYRFRELLDFVEAFTLPKFVGPTPITLLRKIAMQSIASRARALLSFQPITDTDALKLDRSVAAKVHAASGFPWIFNTEIATLPVSLHGFEFPSIRRINASIAVDGLSRDLNHHIPAYRSMALITLADWTCLINDCVNPLAQPGINKDFSRRIHFNTIPAAWIIAQKEMGTMKPPLCLLPTDQSHILKGDLSISHCLKLLKMHDRSFPSGSTAYSLRTAGIRLVKQLGKWLATDNKLVFNPINTDDRLQLLRRQSAAVKTNWLKATHALSHSDICWLCLGSTDLLTEPLQRRDDAELYITALAMTCKFRSSSQPHNNKIWATDGSMIPASSSISDMKHVTAAATGPVTLVLRVPHRNASILQGEQLGLVMALVLADLPPQIYTDHLNSTMLIDDSRTAVNQERRLRSMNGRSYYRWILDLVNRKSATITYTKAHTSNTTLESALNREADHYASSAQKSISSIPVAPVPTFFMDAYTFYREPDGWIESNLRYFTDHFSAKATANRLALLPKHRMATWLYDLNSPPPWVYTKAASAYTALVQLYARSGQLPTAQGMFQKKALYSQNCRFGCADTESPHHIFVKCPHYAELRTKELDSLITSIEKRLLEAKLGPEDQALLLESAKSLFSDSETFWPLDSAAFFLGQIPKIDPLIPPDSMNNLINRSRLVHNITSDMHLSSVRLASRIFGDLQKVMAKRHANSHGSYGLN